MLLGGVIVYLESDHVGNMYNDRKQDYVIIIMSNLQNKVQNQNINLTIGMYMLDETEQATEHVFSNV